MRLTQLVPAAAVLLALGGIATAAQLATPAPPSQQTAPQQKTASQQTVAVTTAARACPPVPGGGSGKVAFIAAAAAAAAAAPTPANGTGQAQLTPLPPAGATLRPPSPLTQTQPALLDILTTPAASKTLQGWSVTATGTMASALEAEEATDAGLASVRCGEPGSDLWFIGPGQQGGAAQVQLDLMNVDALPASVDVAVITDAGRVQAGGDTGITVPPHQTVTEDLSSLAAGASVVAIEVRTSIGRVAADVSESPAHGGTASWLPNTAAPATRLFIPGVPPTGSTAGLYIAVPGNANARISVLAITAQGQHQPFGSQAIDLPGGSASYIPLTPLGGMAALELTSNVPVAAGVLVPGSGLGAFTAATAPISEQAVVAGNVTGATIVLSAPAQAAQVRLTELATTPGVTSSQVVTVPSGHTLTVPAILPKGAKHGSAFAVVITPLAGSGPLYAARVQIQDQTTVTSIIPAVSALTTITLPPVRDSYDAISP
jgi:Family of unknown function (DUF5719)